MTPDPDLTTTSERSDQLAGYLASARWFGSKGREFSVTSVTELTLAPGVTTNLVGLTFADATTELYQVPLSSYDEAQQRIQHAHVGVWDGRFHYDAVHDRDAMGIWLRAFAGDASEHLAAGLAFVRVYDHDLDLTAHSTLFSGEQSNSSVAFGDDSLLKVFRRVTTGINPDIEIHEVLTRSGNTHVPALYGYTEAQVEGPDVIHLAMLQQFLRTASDGWELALASARNLLTEEDVPAHEAGGDFASEAHRLGSTLAEIHQVLADAFGTEPFDAASTQAAMAERLEQTTAIVSRVGALRAALLPRFTAIADISDHSVQRIHGDLHLGQTLRTSLGWKLVDFEGEPAKALAERRLPDSVWRDVAGMLRSLDYAASSMARDLAGSGDEADEVLHRAQAWTAHNTMAFLAGYTEARGHALTADEDALLAAYLADKAIYEVAYEAGHRPGWLPIPLTALTRLAEGIR